ncbi:unnamed protein product [Rotaria sp. Silwood2]|nr:unnamed protein product [Rotaria sp. Silwood2]CAF3063086.1 unnamed protein product [Rotaria sp. Silwood2]CAF4069673.1 unnamed protein product [Rotaria sp. Silwood2]CAF4559894.1 unnamed protein product [Rotaria sp. Silwood2]CAF4612179.1 unnamed protein product [Rotaria sp. Silwood2]
MPAAGRPIPFRCRKMLAGGTFRFGGSYEVHCRPDRAVNILAAGCSTSCSRLARCLGGSSSLEHSVST